MYWLISRFAHAAYSTFPMFGAIRGSVGIIRRDGGFLVIARNDGFGLCFPGGIASFREPPESTVRREVTEETGLSVIDAKLLFDFRQQKPIPVHTYVFELTTEGEVQGSWEGKPTLVNLDELQRGIVPEQRPVVEHLINAGSR
jgi:8-oxo-dGTP pyrophosphatase MutT (NUDIX family)